MVKDEKKGSLTCSSKNKLQRPQVLYFHFHPGNNIAVFKYNAINNEQDHLKW